MLTATLLAVSAAPPAVRAQPEGPPLTAPEGGPVDDGWLPPVGGGFTLFEDEAPPGGDPIWQGVRHEVRSTRVGPGLNVDVQLVHIDPDAPVTVQPSLAGGSIPGLAPVAVQSGDPLSGRVAATNGAFWLSEPVGEPNGLFIRDGRLISDAESQGAGPRGAVGWTAEGRMLIDRVDSVETLTLPDGTPLILDGINRGHREFDDRFPDGIDSLLAYSGTYDTAVAVAEPLRPPSEGTEEPEEPEPVDLAVVTLATPAWPASGTVDATVSSLTRDTPGTYVPGPQEILVVATGGDARALDGLRTGDPVTVGTRIYARAEGRDADWARVVRARAGGPMIVKEGRTTDPADWIDEGFVPETHSYVRAPRTAIGVTAEGRTLMVTADGRRPGVTHGFTILELGLYMIALGAVEALSLDGGGSSQLVVDGVLQNRPCCDEVVRAVADSLQVVHEETFTATLRLGGTGRVDTAAQVARQAYPGGASTAVLAPAGTFPDALAGGPLASLLDGPLLLTAADAVPTVTLAALADLGVRRVILLGGRAVIGQAVADDLDAAGIPWVRVGGRSRFETAAGIARLIKSRLSLENRQVTRAFVAAADGFADALVAAGPGGMLDMPILLSNGDRLHPATAQALDGLEEVVLVGGETRLGPALERWLSDRGMRVTRLAGDGRFGTARAVVDWLATQVDLGPGLVVATGGDFPDALAGGPLAARLGAPLLIVPDHTVAGEPQVTGLLADLGQREPVLVLGGFGAISSYQQWQLDQLVQRLPEPATP